MCLTKKKSTIRQKVLNWFVTQHIVKALTVTFCGCSLTFNVNAQASDSPLLTQCCSCVKLLTVSAGTADVHGMLGWIWISAT